MPLDNEAFVAGVRVGLTGRESRLSPEEMQEALAAFNDLVNEANAELAADNRAAGEVFLAQNAQREGVQVTESGRQYEVICEGDGERPRPPG